MAAVTSQPAVSVASPRRIPRPGAGVFVMTALILGFGFYTLYPILLILINSFNVAGIAQAPVYSLDNWSTAFSRTEIFSALGNTLLIWVVYTSISFPVAVLISWILARTSIPFSHGLEFLFWISFMMPSIATTIGWVLLLDPSRGILNTFLMKLPFVTSAPLNIFSVPGIVFAHLVGNAISSKVILLTPAFRNMSATFEEAAQVSGASKIRTMLTVTLPVMVPAMSVVFLLNLVRIFNSFETELILGRSFNFFVYSTRIYDYIRTYDPPRYGEATALASLTFVVIITIVPLSQWLLNRRNYATVTGSFKPGVTELGRAKWPVFGATLTIIALLTIVPLCFLILGSFMTRVGLFQANPLWTTRHWEVVLSDRFFLQALRTTLILAFSTALISPILFSIIGYVLIRTNWRGRRVLDSIFWLSAAIPGILSGLGLLWMFLRTPGFTVIYGTIYALILVVILQGKLTGTRLFTAVFKQIGGDMEEAARIAGAGWWRTYFTIWLPLIMPTLIVVATLNFILAANTTSSIILLASRETSTLSIIALAAMGREGGSAYEQAGILSIVIIVLTAGVAIAARIFGLKMGLERSHQ
jgi:iron(III) transport system permease protein